MEELDLFAVTAPGLEPLCALELAGLGIDAKAEDGGVAWRGDRRSMHRANLELRTCSRVIARLGTFRARTFPELERHAAKLPWSAFIRPGTEVELRVTARKSKLYHQGAIAERVARVLAETASAHASVSRKDEDDDAVSQLVVVRFMRDVCTISIDSSGTLLHQRGYRQALGKAPLRETIAAAMLLASDFTGDDALLDPLCGSGTLAIEAALIARRIAPGLASPGHAPRAYAFEQWHGHRRGAWNDVVAEARTRIREHAGIAIVAADRNAGAITAATANAVRAGVARDVQLLQRPLAATTAPAPSGHLVTNPPYGVRVGEARELAPLYADLGRIARDALDGWTVGFLAADPRLAGATGLQLAERFVTKNGGIPVRFMVRTAVRTHVAEPETGAPAMEPPRPHMYL
jgi:putative N6-adenine-specific DNA methylase